MQNKFSISKLTRLSNTEALENLSFMNKEKEISPSQKKEAQNKGDASKLLHQVNREIKTLNYKLSKVITTENYHTLLYASRQNEVECLEATPILCKIECQG
jgi:hypothetical protein